MLLVPFNVRGAKTSGDRPVCHCTKRSGSARGASTLRCRRLTGGRGVLLSVLLASPVLLTPLVVVEAVVVVSLSP